MSAISLTFPADALAIVPQTREQSRTLALDELARFLDLVASLGDEDWDKPTACTLWSVRDIVAHQASHVQLGTGVRGFLSQVLSWDTLKHVLRGMNGLDALNKGQVDKRKPLPIGDVIAELRDGMPGSIQARQRMTQLGRQVRLPLPPAGLSTLGTLYDVIFPRDMWMHRHDIAAATGKPFVQTAVHDGTIVEKTVLDMARYAARKLPGVQVTLTLRGVSGGMWRFGSGQPAALAMDAVDFMRRTSERLTVDDALMLTDSDVADATTRMVLTAMLAPY